MLCNNAAKGCMTLRKNATKGSMTLRKNATKGSITLCKSAAQKRRERLHNNSERLLTFIWNIFKLWRDDFLLPFGTLFLWKVSLVYCVLHKCNTLKLLKNFQQAKHLFPWRARKARDTIVIRAKGHDVDSDWTKDNRFAEMHAIGVQRGNLRGWPRRKFVLPTPVHAKRIQSRNDGKREFATKRRRSPGCDAFGSQAWQRWKESLYELAERDPHATCYDETDRSDENVPICWERLLVSTRWDIHAYIWMPQQVQGLCRWRWCIANG